MKGEAYWGVVDTAGELLARILDAAANIKKLADQLRRTNNTRSSHTSCNMNWGLIF
jgi:hypothetical protein